jgi:asparagine synthase (glutamine-hydrolysing)
VCGLAGYVDLRGAPADEGRLRRMGERLAHRGPDDAGTHRDGPVGLAHRRLAIVDLSPAGHQPMHSADAAHSLVYNGEIYNHVELRRELEGLGARFVSTSDTEVILHAYRVWGEACVHRFNGMWALALWDSRRRHVWLSRDRFGVKPLHYAHLPGRFFAFASEAKALLAAFPELARLDREVMLRFLRLGALDWDERTFFADVVSLPAAHHLWAALDGRVQRERYWELDVGAAQASTPRDAPDALRAALTDAVRLRLRSDVEVGTCLSGGLDSTSIVSIATRVLGHAPMQAADWTGVNLHVVRPRPEGLVRDLDRMIWHQEKPASSASLYSQWAVMQQAGRHVRVLLDGQGADELLGGYVHYLGAYVSGEVQALRRDHDPVRAVRLALAYPAMRQLGASNVLSRALVSRLPGPLQRLARRVWHAPPELDIVDPRFGAGADPVTWPEVPARFGDPLLDLLHHQFFVVGLPALLHLEDRSSMAFSVESRVPFTDDLPLVTLCMGLPSAWKISNATTKRVLREGLRGILPDAIRLRRRKLGFPTPLAAWLRRSPALAQAWRTADFERHGLLSKAVIDRLLEAHLAGRADHGEVLFRALTAARWASIFLGA